MPKRSSSIYTDDLGSLKGRIGPAAGAAVCSAVSSWRCEQNPAMEDLCKRGMKLWGFDNAVATGNRRHQMRTGHVTPIADGSRLDKTSGSELPLLCWRLQRAQWTATFPQSYARVRD